jgi:hypothetical protein
MHYIARLVVMYSALEQFFLKKKYTRMHLRMSSESCAFVIEVSDPPLFFCLCVLMRVNLHEECVCMIRSLRVRTRGVTE